MSFGSSKHTYGGFAMTMWNVRAGREGKLFPIFKSQSVVALSAEDLGEDLRTYSSREQIVEALREKYPEGTQQSHRVVAGILYRFGSEVKPGDGVVTYDPNRRMYAVGKITSEYEFNVAPDLCEGWPHIRRVQWEAKEIDRDDLSPTTQNSLRAMLTLFRLPDDAESDVRRAWENDPVDPIIAQPDNTNETLLPDDIEERSIEFIKERVVRLSWDDMQRLVAGVLQARGYKTRISAVGSDRGKDIVASPDGFGFEAPRIVVEVKHRPGSTIGAPEIRSFLGGRHSNDNGLYVSTGGFSQEARYEAERANIPVLLMGLDELVESIIDNYEHMSTEARSLIPLKRVYWPIE